MPEHYVQLRDHAYGPAPRERPTEEEALGQFSGIHSLTGYLSYWAHHHAQVLYDIPRDRLFLFETRNLSDSLDEIAEFVGIDPMTLDPRKSHVHEAPERHGVLNAVPGEYVDGLIEEICGPTVSRLLGIQPDLGWAGSDGLGS